MWAIEPWLLMVAVHERFVSISLALDSLVLAWWCNRRGVAGLPVQSDQLAVQHRSHRIWTEAIGSILNTIKACWQGVFSMLPISTLTWFDMQVKGNIQSTAAKPVKIEHFPISKGSIQSGQSAFAGMPRHLADGSCLHISEPCRKEAARRNFLREKESAG